MFTSPKGGNSNSSSTSSTAVNSSTPGNSNNDLKLKMGLQTPDSLKLKLKSLIWNHHIVIKGRSVHLSKSQNKIAASKKRHGLARNTISDSGAYQEITGMVSNMVTSEGYAAMDLVLVYVAVSNLIPSTQDYTNVEVTYDQYYTNKVMSVVPDPEGIDIDYLDNFLSSTPYLLDPFLYTKLSGDSNYDYQFTYDPSEDFTASWSSNWSSLKLDYTDTNYGTNGYIFTYDDNRKAAKMLYLEQAPNDYNYLANLSMKQDTNSSLHGVWVAYTENYSDSYGKYSYQTVGFADDSGGYLTTTYKEHDVGSPQYTYLYQEGFNSTGTVYAADSEDGGSTWYIYTGDSNQVSSLYYTKYDSYSNEAAADNSDNSAVQDIYNGVYDYLVEASANIDDYFYIYTSPVTTSDIISYNETLTDENLTYDDNYTNLMDRMNTNYIGDGYGVDTGILELDFSDPDLTTGTPLYLYFVSQDWDSGEYGFMSTNCITNTNYGIIPDAYRSIISKKLSKSINNKTLNKKTRLKHKR